MPTTMEGLTQLGQDLRDAVASVLGLRGEMQALKDSTTNNATTIINNFTNRAPSIDVYVDENLGVDAPGRGRTIDTPFKSIDYALQTTDASVIRTFNLLSDVTLRYFTAVFAAVIFRGIIKQPGPRDLPFNFAKRKFSFLPEALNSPRQGTGRGPAFLDAYGPSMTFDWCNVVIPSISPDMTSGWLLVPHGGSITFSSSNIDGEVAGVRSYLVEPFSTRVSVNFYGTTLGPNAPGHVLANIAAGADPRNNFLYETNLTSA